MNDMAISHFKNTPFVMKMRTWCNFVSSNKMASICLFFYILIFSGFFFLETAQHRMAMYLSVPFSLFYIKENFSALKQGFREHAYFVIPFVLFISYTALSALWSDPLEEGFIYNETKPVLFLPLSMATLYLLVKKNDFAYDLLINVFIAAATITGVFLLADNFLSGSVERMEGFGRAGNSVMGGYLYCLALLTVMFAEPMTKIAIKYKIIIGLILFYIMFLMLSRSPLLVLGASIGIMLLARRNYLCILTIGVVGIVGIIGVSGMPRDIIPILNRPDTGRTQVWMGSIEKIIEKPVFGHGIATKFYYPINSEKGTFKETGPHSHNFYLGSLVQGGIISLCFVLYFVITMGWKGYQRFRKEDMVWPFIIFTSCILMGLMNFSSTINNLSVIWIAFWYPCVFIMARETPHPVV